MGHRLSMTGEFELTSPLIAAEDSPQGMTRVSPSTETEKLDVLNARSIQNRAGHDVNRDKSLLFMTTLDQACLRDYGKSINHVLQLIFRHPLSRKWLHLREVSNHA